MGSNPKRVMLISLTGLYSGNPFQFPLGIGYLVSMLQQDRPVHAVHYHDSGAAQRQLPKLITKYTPDIIGLTCTTFNRGAVRQVCAWLRATWPEICIILGGVHASFQYEQALLEYGADYVVIGEGEHTFRELCSTLDNQTSLLEVKGIALIDQTGKVITTAPREVIQNLDDLPIPDHSFAKEYIQKLGMGFIITSRGCPVRCSFCSTSSYWGQRIRTNSPHRVVNEMAQIVKTYGVHKIFFYDDTFNLGISRVRAICNEIMGQGLQVEWGASCRVNPVSQEMIDLMVAAGCRHICWGIETGSPEMLTHIGKKITLTQIHQAFELCRPYTESGVLSVGAFIMVGNPGENEKTIAETIALLNSLPMTDRPSCSILYILPGTLLAYDLQNEIPPLSTFWAESDDIPFYTREHSMETLQKWCMMISECGNTIAFDPKRHFWNNVLSGAVKEILNGEAVTQQSELDRIFPPEIRDDELYTAIMRLATETPACHILEIGSSSGGGSTEAFARGIAQNPAAPILHCMEVSLPRFRALQERYKDQPKISCLHASSVGLNQFPSEKEVALFYQNIPTSLNNYPLETVLGWLKQDIEYIQHSRAPENGIRLIRERYNIDRFDIVLIDGSEFLGKAEFEEIYGASIILLDDINGFKNYHNRQRLLSDSQYHLLHESLQLRTGYSIFIKTTTKPLPIHFFTIVLNGEPFIRHHIEAFKQLPFAWHWHIVEGVADLVHDTAWSVSNGGQITDELHANGLSNDGTSQYLDELAARFPDQVTIYRKPPSQFWNGKLEMVNAPLENIKDECLLWQVDSDELWNAEQITCMHAMFTEQTKKTAAQFICNFYVGPGLAISSVNTYGNHTHYEWFRCWRYEPGDRWLSHEPPILGRHLNRQTDPIDIGAVNPFNHLETAKKGLIFDHFAYAISKQVAFKQVYYGYADAVGRWQKLQQASQFPVLLRNYFPWVADETTVEQAPLITVTHAHILYLRTDAIGDNVLSAGMLPHLKQRYPGALLTVVCQDRVSPLYDACPCVDSVISFNYLRLMTQPNYRQLILEKMNSPQPTLLLNPIFSHDLHDEFLAHHCQAPLKIACQGDASNREQTKFDNMSKLYSLLIPNNPDDLNELDRHQTFLKGIGIKASKLMPQVWTSSADETWADLLLTQHGIPTGQAIMLFPGSLLDCKCYPHYPEVVKQLQEYPIIILGGEELREQGDELCSAHGSPSINLAGKTSLGQMAALMRRGRFYLGSDSAGMHIACAVGLKNVVLLGGGHFGRFCPYSPLTTAVCLPLTCYQCNWRCPHQRVHCLHDIQPETILEAIIYNQADTTGGQEAAVFQQKTLTATDGPLIAQGILKGRFKIAGELNRVTDR